MKLLNLKTLKTILQEECPENSNTTLPLVVTVVGENDVIVSSFTYPRYLKLKGITGVVNGAKLSVNIKTGDVTVLESSPVSETVSTKSKTATLWFY